MDLSLKLQDPLEEARLQDELDEETMLRQGEDEDEGETA